MKHKKRKRSEERFLRGLEERVRWMVETIVISALVSSIVTLAISKHCFDEIDRYVKGITEKMQEIAHLLNHRG